MRYEFKKIVKNDYETYKYLLKIYNSMSYCKDKEMIFDLFGTQRFESNLIAILYLIIELANNYGKVISFIMPDNKIYNGKDGAYKCFNYYANKSYRKSFFKPRCIIGNPNKKEIEDVLTKFLYELELFEQDKISIMIKQEVLDYIY